MRHNLRERQWKGKKSDNYYKVTRLITHYSGESECAFNFSAKDSGDLDIESEEVLKEALLESGILEGVKIFEYGDGMGDISSVCIWAGISLSNYILSVDILFDRRTIRLAMP